MTRSTPPRARPLDLAPTARGIILTNLYATPLQPARGTFNQQQFRALADLQALLIVVPLARRLPCRPRPSLRQRNGTADASTATLLYVDVWHPSFFGRWLNGLLVFLALWFGCRHTLRQWHAQYVLASFAYPEGVAGILLARWLRVPAFIKVHGTDINVMSRSGPRRRQIRWALRQARGVIAVSRPLAEQVRRLGARSSDVLFLPNGIDTNLFHPSERAASRRRMRLPANRRSLLYVGNLKRDKGVMDLASAFTLLAAGCDDVDLDFVGDGPAAVEVRDLVAAHGLQHRIRLHGPCAHEEVPHWLGACDLLCLPSHAEGMPNVVVEALACGRPVVATRVGAVTDLVRGANGCLVEPNSPGDLLTALRACLAVQWDPQALVSSLNVIDWQSNARELERFIGARCGQPAAPVGACLS